MSGISGFRSPEVAALPRMETDHGSRLPPDIKTFNLDLPASLPDTKDMAPGKLFDLLEGYVRDQGSNELKAALEGEEKFVLTVTDEFGNMIEFLVDPINDLASPICDTRNPPDKSGTTVSV